MPGHFWRNSTASCVSECDTGSGEYTDQVEKNCKNCFTRCLTCSSSHSSNCLSCRVPYFHLRNKYDDITEFFFHSPKNRQCVKECPLPYYGDKFDQTCREDCIHESYYKNTFKRICERCHSSCKKCRGPDYSNCLVHVKERSLQAAQSSRTDQTETLTTPGPPITFGLWKSQVYCPDEYYAIGFKHRTDFTPFGSDATALNSLMLKCFNSETASIIYIQSYEGLWGDWSDWINCENDYFMRGYNLGYYTTYKPEVGAIAMKSKCLNGLEITPTQYYDMKKSFSWDWRGFVSCSHGSAICGLNIRYVDAQGALIDDSAMEDVEFYCCALCKASQAMYLSGKECKKCHFSCKTCSGPGENQCNSCYFNINLSKGICKGPESSYILYCLEILYKF
jgi:hypothetical protein